MAKTQGAYYTDGNGGPWRLQPQFAGTGDGAFSGGAAARKAAKKVPLPPERVRIPLARMLLVKGE